MNQFHLVWRAERTDFSEIFFILEAGDGQMMDRRTLLYKAIAKPIIIEH